MKLIVYVYQSLALRHWERLAVKGLRLKQDIWEYIILLFFSQQLRSDQNLVRWIVDSGYCVNWRRVWDGNVLLRRRACLRCHSEDVLLRHVRCSSPVGTAGILIIMNTGGVDRIVHAEHGQAVQSVHVLWLVPKGQKCYSGQDLLTVVVEFHNILAYPVTDSFAYKLFRQVKVSGDVCDWYRLSGRHKPYQIQIYFNKISVGGGHIVVYEKVWYGGICFVFLWCDSDVIHVKNPSNTP